MEGGQNGFILALIIALSFNFKNFYAFFYNSEIDT